MGFLQAPPPVPLFVRPCFFFFTSHVYFLVFMQAAGVPRPSKGEAEELATAGQQEPWPHFLSWGGCVSVVPFKKYFATFFGSVYGGSGRHRSLSMLVTLFSDVAQPPASTHISTCDGKPYPRLHVHGHSNAGIKGDVVPTLSFP